MIAGGMAVGDVGHARPEPASPGRSLLRRRAPGRAARVRSAWASRSCRRRSSRCRACRAAQSGLGSGLLNTSRLMGGALGLAVLRTIADSHTHGAAAAGARALTNGFDLAFEVGAGLCVAGASSRRAAALAPAYRDRRGGDADRVTRDENSANHALPQHTDQFNACHSARRTLATHDVMPARLGEQGVRTDFPERMHFPSRARRAAIADRAQRRCGGGRFQSEWTGRPSAAEEGWGPRGCPVSARRLRRPLEPLKCVSRRVL